jgi:hypothetical protein
VQDWVMAGTREHSVVCLPKLVQQVPTAVCYDHGGDHCFDFRRDILFVGSGVNSNTTSRLRIEAP